MGQAVNTQTTKTMLRKAERQAARDRALLQAAPEAARTCDVVPTDPKGWNIEYGRIADLVNKAQGRVPGVNAYVTVPKHLRADVQSFYHDEPNMLGEFESANGNPYIGNAGAHKMHTARRAYHAYRQAHGIGPDTVKLTPSQKRDALRDYKDSQVTQAAPKPVPVPKSAEDTESRLTAIETAMQAQNALLLALAKKLSK